MDANSVCVTGQSVWCRRPRTAASLPLLGLALVVVVVVFADRVAGIYGPNSEQLRRLVYRPASLASFTDDLNWRVIWLSMFVLFVVLCSGTVVAFTFLSERSLRSLPAPQGRKTRALGRLMLVVSVGSVAALALYGAYGATDRFTGMPLQDLLHGRSWSRGPRFLINLAGTLSVPLIASFVFALVAVVRVSTQASDLSQQRQCATVLRALLGWSSLLLVLGVAMTHVMLCWINAVAIDTSSDSPANPLKGLPQSLSFGYGLLLTTVLVATYVPTAIVVRSCAIAVAGEEAAQSFDLDPRKLATSALSLLGPVLAGLVTGPLSGLLGQAARLASS